MLQKVSLNKNELPCGQFRLGDQRIPTNSEIEEESLNVEIDPKTGVVNPSLINHK